MLCKNFGLPKGQLSLWLVVWMTASSKVFKYNKKQRFKYFTSRCFFKIKFNNDYYNTNPIFFIAFERVLWLKRSAVSSAFL